MRIKGAKYIISPVLFLMIAFFNGNPLQAETIISSSAKPVHTKTSRHFPHAELELVKHKTVPACDRTIQKKIYPAVLIQAFPAGRRQVSSENLFIKSSLLLTRAYLLHIYPFHYFW